ncbi:ATP-binding protein [Streptomyces sparsus]
MKNRVPRSTTPPPQFTQLLSATRRGARLARLLAVEQVVRWGWPRGCEQTGTVELVVAELAANAVLHGRVAGRCFRTGLTLLTDGRLRIEVTDPRGERAPALVRGSGEGGRGLLLVDALAAEWGVRPYLPGGKTVWAEVVAPTVSGPPPLWAFGTRGSPPHG